LLTFKRPLNQEKTMRIQFRRSLGAACLACCALTAALTGSVIAQEISRAEKVLFQSKHFENTKKLTTLNYVFREAVNESDIVNGKVTIDILKHHADGTASVAAHFLTGAREIPIPPIDHAQGNPVILGFLERDIAEMKRLTGGATGYFRKRIRLALAASDGPVKQIKVTYRGSQVSANEITIYPYLDDPLKERLGKYVKKGYVFITSEAVPGTLYRAYTTLENENALRSVVSNMAIAMDDKPG
jgi:tellurite resistance protein